MPLRKLLDIRLRRKHKRQHQFFVLSRISIKCKPASLSIKIFNYYT